MIFCKKCNKLYFVWDEIDTVTRTQTMGYDKEGDKQVESAMYDLQDDILFSTLYYCLYCNSSSEEDVYSDEGVLVVHYDVEESVIIKQLQQFKTGQDEIDFSLLITEKLMEIRKILPQLEEQ